jgi:TetR/AcrR family transcriptional regulator, cholesterol catabolism regulator
VAGEASKSRNGTGKGKTPATRSTRAGRAGGARREQEVLDAATKVFFSRGYADASVQDIADELGILKGSLYHYIDSKEDLLFRLITEVHNDVESILEEVSALEGVGPLERLHEYFVRQGAYMTRHLAKLAIYYHDMDQLSGSRHDALAATRTVHARYVADLIKQAQVEGEVDKDLDPQLMGQFAFGTLIWMYRWYKPSGKFKADAVANGLADFITRSLGAER